MIRTWLATAALGGFLSVAADAIAAHLTADDRAAALLRTGALYGMVHSAVLIAVIAMIGLRDRPPRALIAAGWSFAGGTMLFSLSLFGLALTRIEWLELLTPLGGVSLLLGWAALGLHAFEARHGGTLPPSQVWSWLPRVCNTDQPAGPFAQRKPL